MNIIKVLIQLRDDLVTWVTNNLEALDEKIDNKPVFSGDYNDLSNRPDILDDESDTLDIADSKGNIIVRVGEDGIETTNLKATNLSLGGKDISTIIDENATSDFNELENNPILEDESGDLVIADEDGNIIVKIDSDGLETTQVKAKSMVVGPTNIDVESTLFSQAEIIEDHTTNDNIHITEEERQRWENKSSFSGDFNDLTNNPIEDTTDGNLTIADDSGNIIMRVDENGLETTNLKATNVDNHINDEVKHITADERTAWNAKATTTYVDEKVAGLVNSAPDKLNTLDELAAALGDDENFATTVTNAIAEKAKQSDLISHTGNAGIHVTADDKSKWNAKADSDHTHDFSELENNPILEDTEGNMVIVDESGNIIAEINEDGLATTQITTGNLSVGGKDLDTILENEHNELTALIDKRFKKLGDNPLTNLIGSSATDTPASWVSLGTGQCYIGDLDRAIMTDFPTGGYNSHMLNFVSTGTNSSALHQIIFPLTENATMYHRYGKDNAWITGWVKLFDDNDIIPIANGGTGATTASGALLNLGITATASELNKLDGITVTTAELNYVSGATDNIQTQLNDKVSIEDATGSSYDMDTIFKSGKQFKVYRTNGDTLNTPYKAGLTGTLVGAYILNITGSAGTYGKQIAYINGGNYHFERSMSNGTIDTWKKIVQDTDLGTQVTYSLSGTTLTITTK